VDHDVLQLTRVFERDLSHYHHRCVSPFMKCTLMNDEMGYSWRGSARGQSEDMQAVSSSLATRVSNRLTQHLQGQSSREDMCGSDLRT
jgi:hypothetical protein